MWIKKTIESNFVINFWRSGRISSSWTSHSTIDALIDSSTNLHPLSDKKWIPNDASPWPGAKIYNAIHVRILLNYYWIIAQLWVFYLFNFRYLIDSLITRIQIQHNAIHLEGKLQECIDFLFCRWFFLVTSHNLAFGAGCLRLCYFHALCISCDSFRWPRICSFIKTTKGYMVILFKIGRIFLFFI